MMAFLYMFPFPIPIFGGGAGSKIRDIVGQLSILAFLVELISLIGLVGLAAFCVLKLYDAYYDNKFRKLLMLFHRLFNELLLIENIDKFGKEQRLAIELSKKESIGMLTQLFKRRWYKKRISTNQLNRIKEGLDLLLQDKIDIKNQKEFVRGWINDFASFLR